MCQKKKPLEVCRNVNKTENSTASVVLKTYKINNRLKCDNKCLFYHLTCKKYFKEFVGEAR